MFDKSKTRPECSTVFCKSISLTSGYGTGRRVKKGNGAIKTEQRPSV